MDMDNIYKVLKKFSDDRDWEQYHSPKNLIMALTGEVGELNEIFQWLSEEESQNISGDKKIHTQEEIADIAIYLIRICMKLDINLEEAILDKMKKNELKYPADRFRGDKNKIIKR